MSSAAIDKDRPILTGLAAASALLLAAAAAVPWWRTIDAPEPGYVKVCRLASLCLAVMAGVAAARPQRRIGWGLAASVVALCLPLLLLVHIATADADAISTAIEQTNQADRLIDALEQTDVNLQVAWTEQREMWVTPTISNDYSLVDGLEAASYFVRPGWWLCVLGGTILLVAIWAGAAPAVRSYVRCWRGWAITVLCAAAVGCLGPLVVASGYLIQARHAEARGDHAAALPNYRAAARWDRRLDHSISFHVELGRLYGRAGLTSDPDYWAMVSDLYAADTALEDAYHTYRLHIPQPDANPALRLRWANLLLSRGAIAYNAGRVRSALDLWQVAIGVDPQNVEVMYALGIGYTRAQDYETAAHWWERLAMANEGVGMFKSDFVASVLYRKMITARALAGLTWCNYCLGRLDRALQYDAASKQQAPFGLGEDN